MSEVIVKVDSVSKEYRLGVVSTRTLKGDFQRWWALARGKEDPALKIGESNILNDYKSGGGNSQYVWALKDIDLEIKTGEVLGIIGKNGAGKSTLLKLLSQVTTPTTGEIKLKGKIASLLEVGTGFHPELTGMENIFLNGAILGMTREEIKRKINDIVDFSGVGKYIDTPVKRYSSGMFVRLAFAVAAHLDPEILIVDEVLAVGDAEFHKKAMQKMKEVSRGEGKAVLFVSHNMSSIKYLCNRAILLDKGRILHDGDVDSTIDRYLQMTSGKRNTSEYLTTTDGRINLKMPYWINKSGAIVNYFTYGEEIKLRFELDFVTTFERFNIGIGVNRLDGQRIFTSHLLDDGSFNKPVCYSGRMILDTAFNLETLAPGVYSVSFGIRDENEETILYSEDDLALEIGSVQLKNAGYGVLWHTTKWILQNNNE